MRAVDLEAMPKQEVTEGLGLGDIEQPRKELEKARTVVIIGDNAGETVFDRIVISKIKRMKREEVNVFYGVRSALVIYDTTAEDAIASGLDCDAAIVSTGSTVPGLLLDEATLEFLELYRAADVVISKGQGNYETLGESIGRVIYFLLKAKCQAVAADIRVSQGEYVLLRRG